MSTPKAQLAEELLRRLVAALRAAHLYSPGHPIVGQNLESFMSAMLPLHRLTPTIVIGIVGDDVIVDEMPVAKGENLGSLVRRLRRLGVERITVESGVSSEEIASLLSAINTMDPAPDGEPPAFPPFRHVRVGRLAIDKKTETLDDMTAFRRLYSEAVSSAEAVWESAQTEAQPDATVARNVIDGLAHAVSQNRSALLALTALKDYDNYTFTHMVNVSVLTMGQAKALGIEGRSLREFGLAGLMHDIGKVKTPLDILNKPGKLTDAEFTVMMRHTVDGAEILRATPDIPSVAPIVAFEHHLRLDGSGYPVGATRSTLNLGTMLCRISDVYDAMRSHRGYQDSFPTDRILAVLKQSDGRQFDQHLIRRFSQLIGIYPMGNLVKLNTREIAVVVRVYAPDPRRPRVKVLFDRAGRKLDFPYTLNLWQEANDPERPHAVTVPVDPSTVDVDPLLHVDVSGHEE